MTLYPNVIARLMYEADRAEAIARSTDERGTRLHWGRGINDASYDTQERYLSWAVKAVAAINSSQGDTMGQQHQTKHYALHIENVEKGWTFAITAEGRIETIGDPLLPDVLAMAWESLTRLSRTHQSPENTADNRTYGLEITEIPPLTKE